MITMKFHSLLVLALLPFIVCPPDPDSKGIWFTCCSIQYKHSFVRTEANYPRVKVVLRASRGKYGGVYGGPSIDGRKLYIYTTIPVVDSGGTGGTFSIPPPPGKKRGKGGGEKEKGRKRKKREGKERRKEGGEKREEKKKEGKRKKVYVVPFFSSFFLFSFYFF